MNERLTLRLEIRGRVQGVGYRYAMAEEAARLGLAGWVRNRRDGSVEAVVQGPRAAVEAMCEWAARGPPPACVASVEQGPAEGTYDVFEMRPTP